MAFRYSPKIITDGLHFSIDPANHKSYPGSGTSVSDLVARNTSPVLTNGAGYSSINGGVFSFDGVDDFLLVSSNGKTSGFNTAAYTIELWVYLDPTIADTNSTVWSFDYTSHVTPYYAQNFRYISATDSTRRYQAGWNNNGTYTGGGANALGSANFTGIANQWHHLVFSFRNGSQKIYTNSNVIASSTRTNTITYYDQEVWIGRANYTTGYFGGYIGPVNFYSRELSSTEVAYNFNVHRKRFGI